MILILTALETELTPLRSRLDGDSRFRLACTGIGSACATRVTRSHASGCSLVVSAGCCGGLCPDAAPGVLVIPRRVLNCHGDTVRTAPAPHHGWAELALATAGRLGLTADEGPLVSVYHPLLSPAAKQACRARTGASAVDMETAAIAASTAELGVPYLAVRLLLDAADDQIRISMLQQRMALFGDRLGLCLAESLRSAPPH